MNLKAIRIIEPGPLATVQDKGRYGFRDHGVPLSGAMDLAALRLGNLLVGNDDGAAALEITLGGFKAEFLADLHFVVSGPGGGAKLNGCPLANWTASKARKGDILTLDFYPRCGMRTYLTVSGGIDVAPVMGSRSTYLRAGFGGYEGRALRSGDQLSAGNTEGRPLTGIPKRLIPPYASDITLRVIPGPQNDLVTPEGLNDFLSSTFEITERSDRMGCLLKGPLIGLRKGGDIISDGTVPGAVQVPGSGQPTILLSDCQTAGGYVKIAMVISIDLPLVAQLGPGARLKFESISLTEAREIYLTWEYLFRMHYEKH